MAVDMFIKITGEKGEFKGESIAEGHKDEIQVLAWSWGISQSGTRHDGPGGGAGKANFSDLSITKYYDKSSPNIQKACATGEHVPKAVLVCRKAGGKAVDYLKITLEDVLISSVNAGGSGGEDRFTDSCTLNFAKIKVEYNSQDAAGKAVTGPEFIYDIPATKEG